MLVFVSALVRPYLGRNKSLLHDTPSGEAYRNEITGQGFATEREALQSIFDTMKALEASYGDRLTDLQNQWANR